MISSKQHRTYFMDWMRQQIKSNGEPYSENTITAYASALSTAPEKLKGIDLDTTDIYEISSSEVF